LRDLTNPLRLLVTHLDDGDFVTACDASRNLFAPRLNVLRCLNRIIGVFRTGNRNGLGNQTLRAAQVWVTRILCV
jgi:hypothetical protein